MRVCINTWALYNEGLHLGTWCNIEDYEDTLEELKEIQLEYDLGDDLEPFLADWEDDELGICSESCDLEKLKDTYESYDNLDDNERECLAYMTGYLGMKFEEAIDRVEDVIVYDIDNYEDLAYEFVQEGLYGDIPESISFYLDYEKMGRDLDIEGYYNLYNGKIYRLD